MKKTLLQILEAAKRELKMREKVYPGQIQAGKMNKSQATHEKDCMREIIALIERQILLEKGVVSPSTDFSTGIIERYQMQLTDPIQEKLTKEFNIDTMNVLLVYVDGVLDTISNLSSITRTSPNDVLNLQPPTKLIDFAEITKEQKKTYVYLPIQTLKTHQKIAAFCAAYKQAFDRSYKVTNQDSGLWEKSYKDIGVDREMLDFYMKSTTYPLNGTKCIRDYLTHYSSLDSMYHQMAVGSDGLPNRFDRKLYKELESKNPKAWQQYRTKLRKMGYVEIKTHLGDKTWITVTDQPTQ